MQTEIHSVTRAEIETIFEHSFSNGLTFEVLPSLSRLIAVAILSPADAFSDKYHSSNGLRPSSDR